MGNEVIVKNELEDNNIVANVILKGDLSGLSAEQRVQYYFSLCQSLKLNPLTKPFDLISLNGKIVMYANANCAQQLRDNENISIIEQTVKIEHDIIITIVKAQNGKGRTDIATGAVSVKGLSGDNLANAIMKSETKAKRRVSISLCGLGMMDETELETVPDATKINFDINTGTVDMPKQDKTETEIEYIRQNWTFTPEQSKTIYKKLKEKKLAYYKKESDKFILYIAFDLCENNYEKLKAMFPSNKINEVEELDKEFGQSLEFENQEPA